jgi:hypothetical protein
MNPTTTTAAAAVEATTRPANKRPTLGGLDNAVGGDGGDGPSLSSSSSDHSSPMMMVGRHNNDNNNKSADNNIINDDDNMLMMNNLTNSFQQQLKIVMDNPPVTNPRVEDIEKLAACEMNQLSMQSREQILYDLHGISETLIREIDETPAFTQDHLAKLQLAINEIPTADRVAYNIALTNNPSYVDDPEFQLQFLRSDLFDPQKAAIRYTKHFQAKLELFHEDLLCQDITQDDLGAFYQDSVKCLYSGWIQELPIRDISGRLVSVLFNQAMDPALSPEDKVRFRMDFLFRLVEWVVLCVRVCLYVRLIGHPSSTIY